MAQRALSTHRMYEPFRDPFEGKDPIAEAVVNAIAVTTSLAIDEAATVRRSRFLVLLNVVRAAFRAPESIRAPGGGTRSVVIGVIRGASFSGTVTTQCFADLGEAVVKAMSERGGDLEAAIRGLIEGIAVAAEEIGMDEAAAISAAASGALETAEEFGAGPRLQVRRGLAATVRSTPTSYPRMAGRGRLHVT